jgi:hypothetical protein
VQTVLRLDPGKRRLSEALKSYTRQYGWRLSWEVDRDFPIDYPATLKGTVLEVMEQVVSALKGTDAPVRVKVYDDNKVLRVIHATQ